MTAAKVQNDVATRVFLRHLHDRLWYADGQWCERREDAKSFLSNSDAMAVCNGSCVAGVLVGVNAIGRAVYYLKTDALETPAPHASAEAA